MKWNYHSVSDLRKSILPFLSNMNALIGKINLKQTFMNLYTYLYLSSFQENQEQYILNCSNRTKPKSLPTIFLTLTPLPST